MILKNESHLSKTIVVIAGPTASGKSVFAVEFAEKHNGVIINSDSVQVYKDLEILSSRPSSDALLKVPHKLYGFLDAHESCSAGLWRSLVLKEIQECYQQGKLPIIVGGTGLYLKILIEGLSPIPQVDENIRALARERAQNEGTQTLYNELAELDPVIVTRLKPADSQRVVRAWEVMKSTGIPLSEWQRKCMISSNQQEKIFTNILLLPPREEVNLRADARLDNMLKSGALKEVENILKQNVDPASTIYKAIGLREFATYLKNQISLKEALTKAKIATHQYIKRQYTWFRTQFKADIILK